MAALQVYTVDVMKMSAIIGFLSLVLTAVTFSAELSADDARLLGAMVAEVRRIEPTSQGWRVFLKDGRRLELWETQTGAVGKLAGKRIEFRKDARGWHTGEKAALYSVTNRWIGVPDGTYTKDARGVHFTPPPVRYTENP
jgi:hypothetical protein